MAIETGCQNKNDKTASQGGEIIHLMTGFHSVNTVKILKFGTPQTIAIIVLKIKKFDVPLH